MTFFEVLKDLQQLRDDYKFMSPWTMAHGSYLVTCHLHFCPSPKRKIGMIAASHVARPCHWKSKLRKPPSTPTLLMVGWLQVGWLQVGPQDGCTENEINDLLEKHVQGFLCRCAATRMHFDIWGIYQLLPTFKNIKKKPKPSIYPHKPW